MKKSSRIVFIAFLFCCVVHTTICAQKSPLRTIVVDAGHGGYDGGAKGLFSNEATVSLQVALKLGKALEEAFPECKIVYTRTNSSLPGDLNDLNEANHLRAEMANEAKGDLFISIHCNSAGLKAGGWNARKVVSYKTKKQYVGKGSRRRLKTIRTPIYKTYYVENKVQGTETFIWAADRSSIKSGFISLEENPSTDSTGVTEGDSAIVMPDMNSPEARIRSQLYEKKYFTKSLTLAGFVQDEFVKAGRVNRGVKQRNEKAIWVLQATGMPSILVEIGFITNKEEEIFINSEEGQAQIVGNIVEALKRYRESLTPP